MRAKRVDRLFLSIVLGLLTFGFIVFFSASLSVLAKDSTLFYRIIFNQVVLGLIFGLFAMYLTSRLHYRTWKRYAFLILIFSMLATLLVFLPGFGFEHGGAQRWVSVGAISFQPAELLKVGFVIYFAAWLSLMHRRTHTFTYGVIPLLVLLGFIALILFNQPDTGTFLIISATGTGMFIAAGGKWRHFLLIMLLGIVLFAGLVFTKPYIKDRVMTFINPSDSLGAAYQIKQSLIAIGSGGVFGRGYGQSIQKFDYLPEPIGDSIFAVASEELGFFGGALIIILFLLFAIRGLIIARRAPDIFSRLLVTGLVILIVSQSFINIAAMLGVGPLTGLPLLFISHGGTAMFITLATVGIILNISKYSKTA